METPRPATGVAAAVDQERAPGLFRWVRRRLRGRPDSEHEMTPNRVVFAGSVVLYLVVATWLGSAEAEAMLLATYQPFIVYFAVSFGIFAHLLWKPGVSVGRRLFAMVSDFSMISYAAAAGGIATGFFFPFYLWTVFGNGFRFGNRFLFASMAVANVGFLCVLVATGIWRDYLGLSIALSLCLIMLPLYAAKLIQKLSEAKRQAEEANRAKSAFLASVSHELRTPLNAIIGLGELLRDQIRDREQSSMVQTIANAGRSLLNLINSILDFSRIEAGRMPSNPAEVDLLQAMRQLEEMLVVQARAKSLIFNVHVTARTPTRIFADFGYIEQVLVNLLANAIKFTDTGSVTVAVDAVEQHAERVRLRFEVADTGIGIAPDAQNRIFESFTQADPTIIDRYGGTGLGLAISKQLIKLLNGDIGLQSMPGKGSTFWFEVDVKPLGAEEARPVADGRTVLLLSHDAGLAAHTALSSATVEAADMERARAALESMNAEFERPIALVDLRETVETAAQEEIVRSLRARAVVVAITETPGLGFLSTAMREYCASSLALPECSRDLEQAVRIAKTMADPVTAESDLFAIAAPNGRSLAVLVAEDNRTNQMVIAKILERAGHRVTLTSNGEEAYEALRDGQFDVVLMDVNMPVMNGIEATKLYRFASIGQRRVPIVALTADATSDAWARCEEAGMDAYATKPIEPARLLEIVDRVVSVSDGGAQSDTEQRIVSLREYAPQTITGSVDMATLENLERLGGQAFVADLVVQFSRDTAQLMQSLEAFVAQDDVRGFREAAHALRSSAANVGAVKVFEMCLALRLLTPQELTLDGERQLRRLNEEISRALASLEARVIQRGANAPKLRAAARH